MTNQTKNKFQTIQLLEKQARQYMASGTKQDKDRAKKTLEVAEIVSRCTCNAFTIQHDGKSHINLGYILESATLNALGLTKEDNMHEVKSLVNNTPNILKNKSVKYVYVVIVKSSRRGVYKYNADDVRDKRLTLATLNALPCVYCAELSRVLGL